MKIYRLMVTKRQDNQLEAMISSYKTPTDTVNASFFISKEKAEERSKKIIEAAIVIYGHMHEISTYISEVEVIE